MSKKYLLLKLAEEAAEEAQAAIKHRLHDTDQTRVNLEMELGDLSALSALLMRDGYVNPERINAQATRRLTKEKTRSR